MSWEMTHKEARETKRFRTNANVFASFFSSSQDFVKFGNIVDISEGGAGLLYLGGTEPRGELSYLEIFSSYERLLVGRLPCKIIYDMELRQDPRSTVTLRRCGVQFEQLSEWQASALRTFIESHKADEGAEPASA
jgi:hypothetical protein